MSSAISSLKSQPTSSTLVSTSSSSSSALGPLNGRMSVGLTEMGPVQIAISNPLTISGIGQDAISNIGDGLIEWGLQRRCDRLNGENIDKRKAQDLGRKITRFKSSRGAEMEQYSAHFGKIALLVDKINLAPPSVDRTKFAQEALVEIETCERHLVASERTSLKIEELTNANAWEKYVAKGIFGKNQRSKK